MFATFFNNSYREPVAIPTLPQLDSETQIITVKTIDTVDVQWWISDVPPLMSLFDQQITEMFWKPLTADVQYFWSASSLVPRPHRHVYRLGLVLGLGPRLKCFSLWQSEPGGCMHQFIETYERYTQSFLVTTYIRTWSLAGRWVHASY